MDRGYHIRIILNPASTSPSSSFTPASLFQPLPNHPPKSRRRNALLLPSGEKQDYRLGPISIDWVDFDIMGSMLQSPAGKEKGRGRGHAEATFVPQIRKKSGSTNLPEGVIHVFRDGTARPTQEELEAKTASLTTEGFEDGSEGIMLGVLAVPSWMTPSDFLSFVAPAVDNIGHLRIIRDFAPNRSMVVIKFLNPAAAAEFAEEYNGKPFNSMEPEICHVVHVLSVVIDIDDSVSQAMTSQANIYEIPTCPVCLERMDSAVTGLITVPCSHTFHCMCLSKWGDSRCPVCRYSQTLLSSHPTTSTAARPIPFADPSTPSQSSCSSCSSTTNLWICLICGSIGCGRYGQAHAHAHYEATTHLYALELETQRVWDYAGDGYVHRLIRNKADGKLVELPSAASSVPSGVREEGDRLGPSQADALSAEKIEAIGIEYSYLLTSQLDSQRVYYEEQLMALRTQVTELKGLVDNLTDEFKKERERSRAEENRIRKEEAEKLSSILKEKTKVEHRAEKLGEVSRRLDKELKEEKAVSEGLMANLAKLKEKSESDERKVRELEEQSRDVMFFLDAQQRITSGTGIESEAAGGSIEVVTPPETANSNRKKKKTKKG